MTSFSVGIPRYKPEVLEEMEEAKRISRDPNTKRYGSFAEVLEDIDLGDMKDSCLYTESRKSSCKEIFA